MSVNNGKLESERGRGDEQPESPGGDSTSAEARERTPADASAQTEEQAEPEALSQDVIFEVLKNERRRLTLKYLRTTESTVSLGTLAEHIAAIENDKDVSMVRSNERKRVYVGLYQCHLPKMNDMGIVEFNRDRGLIELTDTAEQLYKYIEFDDDPEPDHWYRYYAGLSILALGATALVWAGVLPFAAPVLTGVVFAFACCTFLHVAADAHARGEDDA